MKFLFLVILYTSVFSGTKVSPVCQRVVASPQHAAVILWEYSKGKHAIEAGRYDAYLYEIDLSTGSVIQLAMPKVEFKDEVIHDVGH